MEVILFLIAVGAIALMGFGVITMVALARGPKSEEKRAAYIAENGGEIADGIFTGDPQVTWTEMSGAKVRLADVLALAGQRGYTLTTSTPSGKYYTAHVFTKVSP